MISSIQKLNFFIGGYHSKDNHLKLENDIIHLVTQEYPFDPEITIIKKDLTDIDSEKLIEEMNRLEIFRWKRNYESMALDGTQWKLEFTYNDVKKKKIYGSNSYPGKTEVDLDYTPEFSSFLDALNKLVGLSHF